MDTKSLSYDELANLLGIERESARHLAFRRRWRRTKGNDGKARVDVPLDALPQPNSPMGASPDTPTDTVTGSEAILTRHTLRGWKRLLRRRRIGLSKSKRAVMKPVRHHGRGTRSPPRSRH